MLNDLRDLDCPSMNFPRNKLRTTAVVANSETNGLRSLAIQSTSEETQLVERAAEISTFFIDAAGGKKINPGLEVESL